MVVLRAGTVPAKILPGGTCSRGAAVVLALALAGCSSARSPYQPSWLAGTEQVQQAAAEPRQRRDLEEDGMEAQVAPPPSIRLVPDDPSQPWSPNYGPQPADSPAAPAPPPARPASPPGLKPTIKPRLASAAGDD